MSKQGFAPAKLPRERTHFKELLLANHFQALTGKEPGAEAKAAGNTNFEELTCVGYQPDLKRLDATVNIKQDVGYSGGICSDGSQEYVKFFTSTDGGASWDEQGTVSFTAWDVDGPKPLEYAASLDVDLDEACCKTENLVLVRAILSWSVPPGGPDDPVVWGNSLDATIQVAPRKSGTLFELFECLDLKLWKEQLVPLVDPEQQVAFGTAKKLTPLELHEAYHGAEVPPHRYLFGHVQELLASPTTLVKQLASPTFELFPGLEKIDFPDLVEPLLDPQGNETYEQIGCLGLNPRTTELVATIDVKLPSGYSGDLCTDGSQERVAFWVDWEDGGGWQYAGTAAVTVHDIGSIPEDGLEYSASLPFPQLYAHRRPCGDGPVTARVRAVLSWQSPPSTSDPYAVPVWGGHRETTILVPPGDPVAGGGGPYLETIGGMDIVDIDAAGLATGHSPTAGFDASEAPFGGKVLFSGHIFNRTAFEFGGPGIYYRVWISTDGGANWEFMKTSFTVTKHVYESSGATAWEHVTQTPQSLGAPWGDGWYRCLEETAPGKHTTVSGNLLGEWRSTGDGEALIYVEAKDAVGSLGSPTPEKLIKLDNTAPTAEVAITSGGGSCGDFKVGDTITGTYSSSDNEALSRVRFLLEPPAPPAVFSLTHVATATTPTTESGTWTLDTKVAAPGLAPCGYVLRFDGFDRAIVNSRWVGHDGRAFVGFCLKE